MLISGRYMADKLYYYTLLVASVKQLFSVLIGLNTYLRNNVTEEFLKNY